eukprot:9568606-Ditylum_brightwellii.AAC.1
MQLYRDLNVYNEVARRAKIICSDPETSFCDDSLSPSEFVAVQEARKRRRLHEVESRNERRSLFKEELPLLSDRKLERFLDNWAMRDEMDQKVSACAPEYTMSCLFKATGRNGEDY